MQLSKNHQKLRHYYQKSQPLTRLRLFIDYGDYVLNTSYTYVLLHERPGCAYAIDILISGLSYRLVVALHPPEGTGEELGLEEGQILYSNSTITVVYTYYPEEMLLVYLENIPFLLILKSTFPSSK